jgi:hypothetical protein
VFQNKYEIKPLVGAGYGYFRYHIQVKEPGRQLGQFSANGSEYSTFEIKEGDATIASGFRPYVLGAIYVRTPWDAQFLGSIDSYWTFFWEFRHTFLRLSSLNLSGDQVLLGIGLMWK